MMLWGVSACNLIWGGIHSAASWLPLRDTETAAARAAPPTINTD